jgi:hypothetical protein
LARASAVVFLLDFFLAVGIYLSVSRQNRQMAAPVSLGHVTIPKRCFKEKSEEKITLSELMEIEG